MAACCKVSHDLFRKAGYLVILEVHSRSPWLKVSVTVQSEKATSPAAL
jgi:hypothetical protein